MLKGCVMVSGGEFAESGRAVEAYLAQKGFAVTRRDMGTKLTPDRLKTMPIQCDVSVWISHGGWDGPMVFGDQVDGEIFGEAQIDPTHTPAQWERLKDAMGVHVRRGGMLVVHACHSAGSNKYEKGLGDDRWVEEVARGMHIYAAGVEGSTASANLQWAVQFAAYALEGKRNRQPSRTYKPGGVQAVPWRGWLNDAR